jgi:N-acyl homoserine lactone hydrolase
LLALSRPATEAGEVEDGEDDPDDPHGNPDPRDDEEEDDPHDDQRNAESDHEHFLPQPEEGKHLIEPHLVADVEANGMRVPVFAHTIAHRDGLVLVDTGLLSSHPLVEEWRPRGYPENLPRDVICVVNTHLHFDHCGGNRLFAGVPIHIQAAARTEPRHVVREWIDFDGATYVEHDGDVEILDGVRLISTPGHCAGHQSVLVENVGVIGGDVAYSFRDLGAGDTEGRRRVLELGLPTWLAHVQRPKVPRPSALQPPRTPAS